MRKSVETGHKELVALKDHADLLQQKYTNLTGGGSIVSLILVECCFGVNEALKMYFKPVRIDNLLIMIRWFINDVFYS